MVSFLYVEKSHNPARQVADLLDKDEIKQELVDDVMCIIPLIENFENRSKNMKNNGGIKILFVAALVLIIFTGTCATASLSNSGGSTWKQL